MRYGKITERKREGAKVSENAKSDRKRGRNEANPFAMFSFSRVRRVPFGRIRPFALPSEMERRGGRSARDAQILALLPEGAGSGVRTASRSAGEAASCISW